MKNFYTRILLLSIISAFLFLPSKLIGQNAGNIESSFHFGKGAGWDYSLSNSSAYHTTIQDGALLSDGKIVFGANLSMDFMHGVRRKALAKINSNGTVDLSFAGPTTINNVTKVYPLSSGKFMMFGTSLGRNAIARYNADGTYDNTWNPAGAGPNDTRLTSLAFQTDGKMIIGGWFTTWNGVTANRIVRLNADGTMDGTFVGNANSTVYEVKILSSGKILIGGDFTQISGVTKGYLALLNSDGTLDNTFPASSGVGPNNRIITIVPLSDSKILISGNFTAYNGTSRNRLFRINADGSPDATFTQTINATCLNLLETSDSKYIAVANTFINRLNNNGTTDATFPQVVATFPGTVNITKGILQPDGKILVFGQFSKLNGIPVEDVGRINADGTIDVTFNELVGANASTTAFQVTSDGKIYTAGSFDGINGKGRGFFVRLNSDGSNDNAYNTGTGPNNGASDVAIDPSTGKAVIVGQFTSVNGVTRTRIARFNTDGTLDATFAPLGGLNNQVNNVVVQSDGKIVVGGSFTQANGTNIGRIARFNTNGTVDATFAANIGSDGFSDQVLAIALQPDGKILVGGYFLTYKGVAARNMCRLNADGTRDANFASPTTGTITVLGITVQPDEKIIVTGQFTAYNGTSRANITRVNSDGSNDPTFVIGTGFNQLTRRSVLTADGKILVSGNFTTFNGVPRNTIARLKANGNIDYIFNPGAGTFGQSGGGAMVGAPTPITLTPQGDIIMGGDFFTYQGKATAYFAKIQGTGCGNLAAPTIALSGGVASYCSPGTRTLTASVGAGYLWSNGATTQAITVSESGSYTCQFIDETCTSAASAPTVITVTQTPATPTITGSNTYCTGGSTVLTSSSANGYIWSNGATSQNITVGSPGNYTVRVINGTCTSASSNTITVSANATAAPSAPSITGATLVCSGSSITLSTPTSLLINQAYLWSDNSSGNTLSVTAAGTYSLKIRNFVTGCTSAVSNVITVTQNPTPATPTISGSNVICNGGTIVLTSSSATGNIWSSGANTQSITVNTAGTYSLYVNNGSCTSATSAVTVTATDFSLTPRTISGFTYSRSLGNKDYYISNSAATWTNARAACISAGGDLVSIETEAEWNSVVGINTTSNYWIGLTDAAQEGTFRWVTGELPTYTFWHPTNPDNYAGNEDYVGVLTGAPFYWNDFSGNENYLYILEISKQTYTASNSPITAGSQLSLTTANLASTTYSWTGPNGFTSSLQSPSITVATPQNAGQYILTSTRLGCEKKDTLQVVVNCPIVATPSISGSTSFCANSNTVLTASASPGYFWSNGETTQSISVTSAGSYTVRAVSNGCTSAVSTTFVTSTIPTGTWLGATTDWNNASNWCGGVPTASTDITLPSNGTLPAITGTIATCRNLTIPAGQTLNIGSGANFNLVGTLSGLGNINGVSGSSLSLVGTTAQTIQRVNVGTLVVNNSAGITLGGNISLSNGVTLTSGILNTGTNNLILLPNATSPTETANSYIIGNIRSNARTVGTGSASMFGITIAAGTDNLDTVMIQRTESAATFNGNQGINHIWSIRAGNQPVSGRQITLSWNARADNGKTLSALQVYRKPDLGGEWIRVGAIQNGSSRSVTVTTTSFSDWTLSDGNAPLPVTLTSFTGKQTQYGNQLNWITSSEVNNQGFNVERSTDGKTFTKIGFVKGYGTTNTKQTYQFSDVNASDAYYRLQQLDFDGKTEYSATIKVGESNIATQLEVFPNPATDKVTITTTGTGTIEIRNNLGQLIITQPAIGTNEINISKLAKGVYTVRFNGVSQKLVVR